MLAGYVRTSTMRQDFDRQVDDIQAVYDPGEWYVDRGETGRDIERDEFQRLIEDLHEIDVVVVTEVSRLTRSMSDLPDILDKFEDHDVKLMTLGPMPDFDPGSALSRAMVQIVFALGEFENEQRRERIQSGIDRAKREGKHIGEPPFGYTTQNGYLVKCEVEWPVLEAAIEDLMTGMSQAAVAREYEALSQPTLSRVCNKIEESDELYEELPFDRREWQLAQIE